MPTENENQIIKPKPLPKSTWLWTYEDLQQEQAPGPQVRPEQPANFVPIPQSPFLWSEPPQAQPQDGQGYGTQARVLPAGEDFVPTVQGPWMATGPEPEGPIQVEPGISIGGGKSGSNLYQAELSAPTKRSLWQQGKGMIRQLATPILGSLQGQAEEDAKRLINADPEREKEFFDPKTGEFTAKGKSAWDNMMRGVDQLQQTWYGLNMLAGDLLGLEDFSKRMMNKVEWEQMEIEANPREVKSIEDISKGFVQGGFEDLGTRTRRTMIYGSQAFFENVPNMLMTLGAGGVAGMVTKKLLKKQIDKAVVDQAIAVAVRRKILMSQAGGIIGASTGLETGQIYIDMATRGIRGPVPALVALASGFAAGFLEGVTPLLALKRIGGEPIRSPIEAFIRSTVGEAIMEKGVVRFGVGGFEGMMSEGITEYLQTAIEAAARMSQDPAVQGRFWDEFFRGVELRTELREAMVQGALAGGPSTAISTWIGDRLNQIKDAADRRAFELGIRHGLANINKPNMRPVEIKDKDGNPQLSTDGKPIVVYVPVQPSPVPEDITRVIPPGPESWIVRNEVQAAGLDRTGMVMEGALRAPPIDLQAATEAMREIPAPVGPEGRAIQEVASQAEAEDRAIREAQGAVTQGTPEAPAQQPAPPAAQQAPAAGAVQVAPEASGVTPEPEVVTEPGPAPAAEPPAPPQPGETIQVPPAPPGVSEQANFVDEILNRYWTDLSPLYDVVNTSKQFPEEVLQILKKRNLNPDAVPAFFHRGRVFFNASKFQVGDAKAVYQKVAHEMFIHLGLRRGLGDRRFGRLLADIFNTLDDQTKRQIAAKYGIPLTAEGVIAEEWLAREAERVIRESKTNGLWRNIAAAIRGALRRLGIDLSVSDVEIARWLRMGEEGAEMAAVMGPAGAETRLSVNQVEMVDQGFGGGVVQDSATQIMSDEAFERRITNVMADQTGQRVPEEPVTDPWSQEEVDGETTRFSLEPPYGLTTTALKIWVANMDPQSHEIYRYYKQFNDAERTISKDPLNVFKRKKGEAPKPQKLKSGAVYNRSLTTRELNDFIRENPHVQKSFAWAASRIDEPTRRQMGLRINGTFELGMWDRGNLFVYRSFMQRLMDARNVTKKESFPLDYISPDSGMAVFVGPPGTTGAMPMPTDEHYRRAILSERRQQWFQGLIKKVKGPASITFDSWGTMGFVSKNDKTFGSGDFTTLCPQMYINNGCRYCYRRQALTSNINNKLGAEKVWYTGDFLRLNRRTVDAMNAVGGFRIQSFGDFFAEDAQTRAMIADMLYDAELIGLQVKIITKDTRMVEYLAGIRAQALPVSRADGSTGFVGQHMFANLSADYMMEEAARRGTADQPLTFEPGRPIEQLPPTREGGRPGTFWKRALSIEEADQVAQKYPWVNVRVVALTVEEFLRALQDPRVSVVTGYHGPIRQMRRISVLEDGGTRYEVEVEPIGDSGMPRFNRRTGRLIDVGKTEVQQKLAYGIASLGLQDRYYRKSCCITGKCASCATACGAANADKYTGDTTFSESELLRENRLTVERVMRDYTDAKRKVQYVRQANINQKTAARKLVRDIEATGINRENPGPRFSIEDAPETVPNMGVTGDLIPANSDEGRFKEHDRDMMTRFAVSRSNITQAEMNALLVKYGQEPIEKQAPQAVRNILEATRNKIRNHPGFIDDIIKRHKEKKTGLLSTEENFALNYWSIILRTEFENASNKMREAEEGGRHQEALAWQFDANFWLEAFQDLAGILDKAGSEAGRAFWARQVVIGMDWTYDGLINQKRAANGWKLLDPDELRALQRKAARYKRLTNQMRARNKELQKQALNATLKYNQEEVAKINPEVWALAQQMVEDQRKRARNAVDRLKVKWERAFPDKPLRLAVEEGGGVPPLDDSILSELAIIGGVKMFENILERQEWADSMIYQFGDAISPYLDQVWELSQADYKQQLAGGRAQRESMRAAERRRPDKAAVVEPTTTEKIGLDVAKLKQVRDKFTESTEPISLIDDAYYFPIQRLVRDIITDDPLIDRERLVDAVYEILSAEDMLPGVTRDEVADGISGRGRKIEPSDDEISVKQRDLKAQIRIDSNIQEVKLTGSYPPTGFIRDPMTDEQRRLTAEFNEAKRRYMETGVDRGAQRRSYLDSRKHWYRNRMSDMLFEIKNRELIRQKTKDETTDPELERLKAEYKLIKAQHDEIFGPPDLTDEERLARAERAAERLIGIMEEDLANKRVTAKGKKDPVTSAKLEALRMRIVQIRAEQEWAQRDMERPTGVYTPEQIKEWKRLDRRITKLQAEIDSEDVFPKDKPITVTGWPKGIQDKQTKLDQLLEQRKEMRKRLGPPPLSPLERAAKYRIAVLRRQIADLQDRIASRNFGPRRQTSEFDLSGNVEVVQMETTRDALRAEYNALEEEFGPSRERTPEQRRVAAEKAAQRVLDKLEKQWSTGVAQAGPKPTPVQSAKLSALRAQITELRALIEWRERGMQPPDGLTDPDQIRRWFQLDRQIRAIEDQIAAAQARPEAILPARPERPPEAPANQVLLDRLAALQDERKQMRDALKPPGPTELEKAINRRKAVLRRQIRDYEDRLARRDFAPRRRAEPVDISTDREAVELESKVNRLVSDFRFELEQDAWDRRTMLSKIWWWIRAGLNASVNLVSAIDFSGFRQALLAMISLATRVPQNPFKWTPRIARIWWRMYVSFFSRKMADKYMATVSLRSQKSGGADRLAKLEYSDINSDSFTRGEEAMRSVWDQWARVPYWQTGQPIRNIALAPVRLASKSVAGSNRAFAVFLNLTRMTLFDALVEANFKNRPPTETELQVIGNWVNVATGRGKLNPGWAAVMSKIFWAPKLAASRVQFLAFQPLYTGQRAGSAKARRIVAFEMARVWSSMIFLYFIGRAFLTQKQEDDPTSSDFAKWIQNNTRIDPWGGIQQYIVLTARTLMGRAKTTEGNYRQYFSEEKAYPTGLAMTYWNFMRSKFRPDVAAFIDVLTRGDFRGDRTTVKGEVENLTTPLSLREVVAIMEDNGIPKGVILQILNTHGLSVDVYEQAPGPYGVPETRTR